MAADWLLNGCQYNRRQLEARTALASNNRPKFSLRTLALFTVIGPPQFALAWFGGIYLWHAELDLWLLGRYLFFPV